MGMECAIPTTLLRPFLEIAISVSVSRYFTLVLRLIEQDKTVVNIKIRALKV